MAIKSINISGPVCATSYGIITQAVIKHLIKRNIEVSLRPIGQMDPDIGCGYQEYINRCNPNFIKDAAHLIIWHQFDLKKFLQPNCLNVGFPIFELDSFDERERENLNSCGALIICSQWGVDILKKFCPDKPIGKVSLGVDTDIFSFSTKSSDTHSKIKFLSAGKWEIRKNQIAVMKAFAEVFKDIDDAKLTFLCQNDFIGNENEKWAQLAYQICGDKVEVIKERFVSHKEVAAFLNKQDVGVFPSLGEGWGLEAAELMALNKIVIATDYSGHTEFLNTDNALLIDIDETEPAFDFRWFFGQGRWAKFGPKQHEQLKSHMWTVYQNIKQSRKFGFTKPARPATIYSWDKSVENLLMFLEDINDA